MYKPDITEFNGDYLTADVKTDDLYYYTDDLYYYQETENEPLASYLTRSGIISEMKEDDFEQYLTDYSKSINVEKNIDLIATYSPKMFVDYEKEHPSDTDEVG